MTLLIWRLPSIFSRRLDNFYGTFWIQVQVRMLRLTISRTTKERTPTAITISNNDDNGMWKCSNSLVYFFWMSLLALITITRKAFKTCLVLRISFNCIFSSCFPFLSNLPWFFFLDQHRFVLFECTHKEQ